MTKLWASSNWKHCRRQNEYDYKIQIMLGMAENIVGKEENAGYQHFLLYPQWLQKSYSTGLWKPGIV